MPGLNENHRRHLLLTFQHVDESLTRVFMASTAKDTDSPFPPFKYNVMPDQHRLIAGYLRSLRQAMARILRTHGIAITEPEISALWAFRSALMGATTTIEELRPQYMVGYGPLDESARTDLETISAELLNLIAQLGRCLAEPSGMDIPSRLRRLTGPHDGAALATVLDRIIMRHNLMEIRPALAVLVERMTQAELEIAVFGRVSAGKSSLLNFLWERNILPIGALPVTSVPTRLRQAEALRVTVTLASEAPVEIDPAQLAEFVTQSRNAENYKHVTGIFIDLPSTRFPQGVTFVDTPGVGSLDSQGVTDAQTYLPRCDIGLVLVNAATGLTDLDIDLVEALHRAGARVMVLMTKADLLTELDRAAMRTFVQNQLRKLAVDSPTVDAISVYPPWTQLAQDWLERELLPLLQEAGKIREESLVYKLHHLRQTVLDILQARYSAKGNPPSQPQNPSIYRILAQGTAVLDAAGRAGPASQPTAEQWADEVIHQAAQTWALNRLESHGISMALVAAANTVAQHAANAIAAPIISARDQAASAIRTAADLLHVAPSEELPPIKGLPIFDPAPLAEPTHLPSPGWATIGSSMRRHAMERQLHQAVSHRLHTLMADYHQRLWQWHRDTINALTVRYDACAGVLRGLGDSDPEAAPASEIQADVAELERLAEPDESSC